MSKDLQTLNGQSKLALWAGRISACRNSGQNVKAWCQENGICEQTYYKWQRRLFEMAQSQQEAHFAEVTPVAPVRLPNSLQPNCPHRSSETGSPLKRIGQATHMGGPHTLLLAFLKNSP